MSEKILFRAENVSGIKRAFNRFTLSNINFSLPEGYIMGIVGRNGAGKTTFFDYITDRRKKYSGSFILGDREIHDDIRSTLDSVAFVSEDINYFRKGTAADNAELTGMFYSRFDYSVFESLMEKMKLSPGMKVSAMSKGQNIRFQTALALSHFPELILLDEPTAGMDPVFKKEFYRILKNYLDRGGCSVIMSSNLEEDIENQFDYTGYFENGVFTGFSENIPVQ